MVLWGMVATAWNGSPIYFLVDPPDWRTPVRTGFEFATLTEAGLSNREARRPLGATLRVVLQFQTVATGAAATRLADALRAWQTEVVAIPFWPAAVPWVDRDSAPITSKLKVVYRPNFSTWSLFEESAPEWPTDGDMVAPVLLGRVARNDPVWLTPMTCRFDVDFEEASASEYALTVTEVEWAAGPEPSDAWAGKAPRLMPFRLHHEQPTLGSSVEIERERLGFGRQPVETLYPQSNYRRGEAPFVEASGPDIAALLRFFVDHGEGQSFWAPSWSAAGILADDVGQDDSEISVQPGHDVRDGDWIIFRDDGREATARVVTAAAESLTLPQPIGAWSTRALVSHLLLCRFERPRIQVDWLAPTVAKVRLAIRELPAEYTPAADETLGITLGRLPTRAWLYEMREPTAGGAVTVHRYTSFEHDLEVDGESYRANPIDHGAIRQGLALDRDEVEVRLAITPGDVEHPLVRLATLRSEAPLTLRIRRIDLVLNPS